MPPIPFDDGQASGWDELTGAAPQFINAVREFPGGFRARPGIAALEDFPLSPPSTTAVDAMTVLGNDVIYTTRDRKVFAWRPNEEAVIDLSSGGGESLIAGTEPVMLAASRNFVIAAGGNAPQIITQGLISRRLGGSPPFATDVAMIAQVIVLVAADRSGLFYWSDPGDTGAEFWDFDLAFAEAEARPDKLVACRTTERELWLFGTQTVQVFVPDEDAIFVPSIVIEGGVTSKRSPFRYNNQLNWLTDHSSIVLSGGEPITKDNTLSDQGIGSTLAKIEEELGAAGTADAWGFRAKVGDHDFLTTVFPTAGRAFAWDAATEHWAEWRGWRNGRWQAFAPTSYLWWPERKLHLVGLSDGRIAQLSASAYTDLGATLRWVSRTGFVAGEGEDSRRRQCVDARFRLRRSTLPTASSGTVDVRWRDDLGGFTRPITTRLGGSNAPVVSISPAGAPYEQRQWEISGAANDAFGLASATEIVEACE